MTFVEYRHKFRTKRNRMSDDSNEMKPKRNLSGTISP